MLIDVRHLYLRERKEHRLIQVWAERDGGFRILVLKFAKNQVQMEIPSIPYHLHENQVAVEKWILEYRENYLLEDGWIELEGDRRHYSPEAVQDYYKDVPDEGEGSLAVDG